MRPARALIDLNALRHNYRLARELAGGRALAVVKADAYGHGAVACARALQEDADGFAVACIEEALELRESGIRKPILLLEGFFEPSELTLIDRLGLWTVIMADWQIAAVEASRPANPLTLFLKMDSGMHRVGFFPRDYPQAYRRLQGCGKVGRIVCMTHLARADEPDSDSTTRQLDIFRGVTDNLAAETSLQNSAAIMQWPQSRADWGRPGIMLYGVSPFDMPQTQAARLKPVMTLETRILCVRDLAAGEAVGYGGRFMTEQPARIGVAAIGYADGYPRHAPDGALVFIGDQPGRLAGRVSMDMITLDLTEHPQAGLGTPVELWGNHVAVGDLARHCGTIGYQLLCNLKRVPRSYLSQC